MNLEKVMAHLESHGSDAVKRVYMSHGAREPLFGVKLGDFKGLRKLIGRDHALAAQLWATGNSDAMYLAGLIEDPALVTKEQLDAWVQDAYWDMLSERCVAVLAAKSPHGFDLARTWIRHDAEMVVCAGYATIATLYSITPDDQIDLAEGDALLDEIAKTIHDQSPHIQNAMNNLLITAGIRVAPLFERAMAVARTIGAIEPVVAANNCNIQTAAEYLEEYAAQKKIGTKIKNLNR